jgi:predicted anti-sigma-YlaC factor YlaD
MNCKEINKSVIKFIEKELTPEKENEFNEHIQECKECSGMYSSVAETYKAIDIYKEIEPKAFFTESVMNKIDSEKVTESIFDVTLDIAVSAFFKKFAYTGVAFIIALFIVLYSTGNLSFNNTAEEDFSTNAVSSLFFENN